VQTPRASASRWRAGEGLGRLWMVGGWGGYGNCGAEEKAAYKNRNVEPLREYFVESTHNDKFLILKRITNFLSTSINSFSANCPTLPIAKP